jgi:hypothetical protein
MAKNFTDEKTALLEAAAIGHTAGVIEVLAGSTQIDTKDASGATALMPKENFWAFHPSSLP